MKFKVLDFNENVKYDGNKCVVPLTESTLGRVLHGHKDSGYAIVSPCREKSNLEAELGRTLTDDEYEGIIEDRVIEFKQDLMRLGYSYIHAYGGYKEEGSDDVSYEKSFIVYPFSRKGEQEDYEVFFNDMLDLGKKYNQDSILRKHPKENAKYIACKNGKTMMEFNGITVNDIAQEYFTALRKNDIKSPKRFSYTYEGLYITKAGSIMEGHRRYSMNELFVQ